MDIEVPQHILEALAGGGIVATLTLGLLEWLKSRDWFRWKTGDILIVFSVVIGVVVALLFRAFGWFVSDTGVGEVLGFGFASGLGASILRDVFTNVFQSRQTVVFIDQSEEVSEEQLTAAIQELEGEHNERRE